MDPLHILLHGQAQLLDWGESRATGPWVKVRLEDPELLSIFRGMDTASQTKTGHILNITLSEGDIVPADAPDAHPYKLQAAMLWKSFFLRTPKVWDALGVRHLNDQDARNNRIKAAHKRAWDALKARLGYESMADVPPAEVVEWATQAGVERSLPVEYRAQ